MRVRAYCTADLQYELEAGNRPSLLRRVKVTVNPTPCICGRCRGDDITNLGEGSRALTFLPLPHLEV